MSASMQPYFKQPSCTKHQPSQAASLVVTLLVLLLASSALQPTRAASSRNPINVLTTKSLRGTDAAVPSTSESSLSTSVHDPRPSTSSPLSEGELHAQAPVTDPHQPARLLIDYDLVYDPRDIPSIPPPRPSPPPSRSPRPSPAPPLPPSPPAPRAVPAPAPGAALPPPPSPSPPPSQTPRLRPPPRSSQQQDPCSTFTTSSSSRAPAPPGAQQRHRLLLDDDLAYDISMSVPVTTSPSPPPSTACTAPPSPPHVHGYDGGSSANGVVEPATAGSLPNTGIP
jgi:hypothetical protein